MKTLAEIRKVRNAYRHLQKQGCCCTQPLHVLECLIGGKIMAANARLLSWILEEDGGEGDRLIEELLKVAAAR